jgi:hypothetical protein
MTMTRQVGRKLHRPPAELELAISNAIDVRNHWKAGHFDRARGGLRGSSQ